MCIRDRDWLAPSGLSTRDFIAPASFEFPDGRTFRIGEKFCGASFLQITAADPVSYTHLDVYKRQRMCRTHEADQCRKA